jgi:hypothetical protein
MSGNTVPLVGNPGNGANALATSNGTDQVTALLLRAATDPSFDAAKFETAVGFLRERENRMGHRAFNEAMSNASGEMQEVPRDKSNDYLHSRYATLPGMLGVIKPIAAKYGLAFRFGTLPHQDPDWMTITCILSLGDHEEVTALSGPILSGEGIKGGKTQMNNLQAVGGTVTYLSRYLLGMVFSLIQHMPDIAADNDGGDPTRKPRGGTSPASQPPADVKPDITKGLQKFPSLQTQLLKVPTLEQLEVFKANAKFIAFWDSKTKPDGMLIDDMLRHRRLELEAVAESERVVAEARAKAAAAQAAEAAAKETAEATVVAPAPADYVPDDEPELSPEAKTLIDRINSCHTMGEIDAFMGAADTTLAIAKLTTEADGDAVTAAYKARASDLS